MKDFGLLCSILANGCVKDEKCFMRSAFACLRAYLDHLLQFLDEIHLVFEPSCSVNEDVVNSFSLG